MVDDFVVVADCEHDLKVPCDVVGSVGQEVALQIWCGTHQICNHGVGPARLVPICAVTLAGVSLPQVSEYPYLGATLTSSSLGFPTFAK